MGLKLSRDDGQLACNCHSDVRSGQKSVLTSRESAHNHERFQYEFHNVE